jgi:hypothetical protein
VVGYGQSSASQRWNLVSGSTRVLSVLDDRVAVASGASDED